ncbi:ABC transporter permease [Sutterella sp.]|uniref:ABC transporter permease n=1 Tax=Sutterella sp. TaxID=1981025 RepID=UPI0026DF958E|nr:ABC transporter permease [Sutterella sp.]MDO5532470.1 ABC transporter permease [Sutterella sp.]
MTARRPGPLLPVFSLGRFLALLGKEYAQMRRDPASIFVGTLLPVILILLFGWGLSMDLTRVPVALITAEESPLVTAAAAEFEGSRYFAVSRVNSRAEAEHLLASRRVDAIVDFPAGFSRDAAAGNAVLGLTIHGVDASAASIIRTYIKATVGLMQEKVTLREESTQVVGVNASAASTASVGAVSLVSRSWFNEANTSAWYLVPGLTVVVLTLSASFLGSVVIAREWERGTMETLCITPAAPAEILLSKFLSILSVAAVGAVLSWLTAVAVFGTPVRGNLGLLAATILVYAAWAIAFGLFLSAHFRIQFLAIQLAVIGSYLPSLILSGYLFDLRSVPDFIAVTGRLLPATYAIESVKILYLSGGPERLVLSNLAILGAWCVGFLALALMATKKRLD